MVRGHEEMDRPNVFIAFPKDLVRDTFFPPEVVTRLLSLADVRWQEQETKLTQSEFATAPR